MYIIAGLGNPGDQYLLTRHNAGFLMVDKIVDQVGVKCDTKEFDGLCARGKLFEEQCIFVKPLTYMNLSGNSVCPLMRFYKVRIDQLIVIHDDVDVPFGKVKAKIGGSDGGHNGIKSIIETCGDEQFHRLKLGIGKPEKVATGDGIDTRAWVLAPMTKEELEILAKKMYQDVLVRIENIFKKQRIH